MNIDTQNQNKQNIQQHAPPIQEDPKAVAKRQIFGELNGGEDFFERKLQDVKLPINITQQKHFAKHNQRIMKTFNPQAKMPILNQKAMPSMKGDSDGWRRVRQQFNLKPLDDTDKDGVVNMLDCWPRNKKKQGPYHDVKESFLGLVTGRSRQERAELRHQRIQRQNAIEEIKNKERQKLKNAQARAQVRAQFKQQQADDRALQNDFNRAAAMLSKQVSSTSYFSGTYLPKRQADPSVTGWQLGSAKLKSFLGSSSRKSKNRFI